MSLLHYMILDTLKNNNNRWMSCQEIVDDIRTNISPRVTYAQVYYAIQSVLHLCILEKDIVDAKHVRYRIYQ